MCSVRTAIVALAAQEGDKTKCTGSWQALGRVLGLESLGLATAALAATSMQEVSIHRLLAWQLPPNIASC